MSEPEQPGYLAAYERVRDDFREEVLGRATDQLVSEGFPSCVLLASHLLVGAYRQRQGDELVPGEPRDPEELHAIRGINLSRDRIGELTIRLAEVIQEVTDPKERINDQASDVDAGDGRNILLRQINKLDNLDEEQLAAITARVQRAPDAAAELDRLGSAGRHVLQGTANRLRSEIVDGQTARDELAVSYLPLGVYIAQRFQGRGLDLEDLIGSASEHLVRMARSWDPARATFDTYVRQGLHRYIARDVANSAKIIHIPIRVLNDVRDLYKAERELAQNSVEATDESVAVETGWEVSKVAQMREVRRNLPVVKPLTHWDETQPLPEESDDIEFDGLKPRYRAPMTPEEETPAFEVAFARQSIGGALATLAENEAKVVRLRYGLDGEDPKTRQEIGKALGVSNERVRQIEEKTLKKLQHPSRTDKLRGYFDIRPQY